jgi:hypothetical protein
VPSRALGKPWIIEHSLGHEGKGLPGAERRLNEARRHIEHSVAEPGFDTGVTVVEPYRDGSGQGYGPLIRQPVLVFSATGPDLTRTLQRARDRAVIPSRYTRELFATGHDEANRAAVAAVPTQALDLVGLALHAERNNVDKIVKGLTLQG